MIRDYWFLGLLSRAPKPLNQLSKILTVVIHSTLTFTSQTLKVQLTVTVPVLGKGQLQLTLYIKYYIIIGLTFLYFITDNLLDLTWEPVVSRYRPLNRHSLIHHCSSMIISTNVRIRSMGRNLRVGEKVMLDE